MEFGVCGLKEYAIERLHRDYALLTQQDLSFQCWVYVAVRRSQKRPSTYKIEGDPWSAWDKSI